MNLAGATMSLARIGLCALVVTATVLATVSMAGAGGCEAPTPGDIGITVNQNASGTKLSGTLALAYDVTGVDPTCDTQVRADVIAVLRLAKGNSLATFSDGAPAICLGDVASQKTLIQNLVQNHVIPTFFPDNPGIIFDATCSVPATWCVKSLTNIMPTATPTNDTRSWTMDIVLAVRN
jgi:hypothetical protein